MFAGTILFFSPICSKLVQLIKYYSIMCCLWGTAMPLMAQQLSGKVIDSINGQALEFAAMALLKAGTTTILTTTMTDRDGKFKFSMQDSVVGLHVQLIGYAPKMLENILVREHNTSLIIGLVPTVTNLETITVTSERSTLEFQMDKKVYHMGKDIQAKGRDALEQLNQIPSVYVNPLGTISLRGNTSIRILINGKPSAITSGNGLAQISAESIEKIEVITNPSAEYDAQGAAGIINIVLKKDQKYGWGSSMTIFGGVPANNGVGWNSNFKRKNFNLFSDIRYFHQAYDGDRQMRRTNFSNLQPSSFIEQAIFRARSFKRLTAYVGSDVYFNDKNTLTLSYYFIGGNNSDSVQYTTQYTQLLPDSLGRSFTTELYHEPQRSHQFELNFVKQFTQPQQQLKLVAQYILWNDDENTQILERSQEFNQWKNNYTNSRDVESSDEWLLHGDFTLPISKVGKVSLGLKSEFRNIKSDYIVWDQGLQVDSFTNKLDYTELINGAYFQFSGTFSKWQIQAGLRTEYFNTGSNDRRGEFNIEKKYFNAFPSIHITYTWNSSVDFQCSYSKRIDRPTFGQLNPFGTIADRRNIRIGNPDLNPMYIDVAELGWIIRTKSSFTINPSIYYQYIHNLFERLVTRNSAGTLVEKPVNIGNEHRYGMELNLSKALKPWWNASVDLNAYGFQQQGVVTNSDFTWTARVQSRVKKKGWTLQNTFIYTGAKNTGIFLQRPVFTADVAVSKDLWKEAGNLTLKAENVFDSRIFSYTIAQPEYSLSSRQRLYGTRVQLVFSYKWNRGKSDKDRIPE